MHLPVWCSLHRTDPMRKKKNDTNKEDTTDRVITNQCSAVGSKELPPSQDLIANATSLLEELSFVEFLKGIEPEEEFWNRIEFVGISQKMNEEIKSMHEMIGTCEETESNDSKNEEVNDFTRVVSSQKHKNQSSDIAETSNASECEESYIEDNGYNSDDESQYDYTAKGRLLEVNEVICHDSSVQNDQNRNSADEVVKDSTNHKEEYEDDGVEFEYSNEDSDHQEDVRNGLRSANAEVNEDGAEYPNGFSNDDNEGNSDVVYESEDEEEKKETPSDTTLGKQGNECDQEVANPTIVPRRTGFWDHDNRFTDISIEESRLPADNRKLWDKTEVYRWEHDRYVESQQGPKEDWEKVASRTEVEERERLQGGNRNRRRPKVADFLPNSDNYGNNSTRNSPSGRRSDSNRFARTQNNKEMKQNNEEKREYYQERSDYHHSIQEADRRNTIYNQENYTNKQKHLNNNQPTRAIPDSYHSEESYQGSFDKDIDSSQYFNSNKNKGRNTKQIKSFGDNNKQNSYKRHGYVNHEYAETTNHSILNEENDSKCKAEIINNKNDQQSLVYDGLNLNSNHKSPARQKINDIPVYELDKQCSLPNYDNQLDKQQQVWQKPSHQHNQYILHTEQHAQRQSAIPHEERSSSAIREEAPSKASHGRGRGIVDSNFKPMYRAGEFNREKSSREKRIDQLAPRLREKAWEKIICKERGKDRDSEEGVECDPEAFKDLDEIVPDEISRDKPKRYSSQRQKPGSSLLDLPMEIRENREIQYSDPPYESVDMNKSLKIKILEQQIMQLQTQLHEQSLGPTNVPPNYTIHSNGMVPSLPENHQRESHGYNMESVYNGMMQSSNIDDISQVNHQPQMSHMLPGVGYPNLPQQNLMHGALYVPQQQQFAMGDYGYQQSVRTLRPAAIPIKPPPGLPR